MQIKEDETYFGTPDHISEMVNAFVEKGKELRATPESATIAAAQCAAITLISSGMKTMRSENDNMIVHVTIEYKNQHPGVMEA